MNRLIIVGNGFDLAHGLKTRYSDFITDYFTNAFNTAKTEKTYNDGLFSITKDQPYETAFNFIDFLESFNMTNVQWYHQYNAFTYNFQSKFLGELIRKNGSNWVDIENDYFNALMHVYHLSDGHTRNGAIAALNNSFSLLRDNLKTYLSKQKREVDKQNSAYQQMKRILDQKISYNDTIGHDSEHDVTCVLNFNYTNTFDCYIDNNKMYQINIHGKLEDSDNPIIFGYGDDSHTGYSSLENLNDRNFMINMKSMHYSRNNNYHELLHFMDTGILPGIHNKRFASFEVIIIGHSCGLSDRTLFNTIFEHPNCKKIHACYHESKEDHFYKTIEISRHFKSKQDMRKKFQGFRSDLLIPQFQKANASTINRLSIDTNIPVQNPNN